MAKTSNSQIFARGSFRTRTLAVFGSKNLPLVFCPYTPIIYGVLVDRTIPLAQEIDAEGAGRHSAGSRGVVWNREDRGGELDEKEKEGGR